MDAWQRQEEGAQYICVSDGVTGNGYLSRRPGTVLHKSDHVRVFASLQLPEPMVLEYSQTAPSKKGWAPVDEAANQEYPRATSNMVEASDNLYDLECGMQMLSETVDYDTAASRRRGAQKQMNSPMNAIRRALRNAKGEERVSLVKQYRKAKKENRRQRMKLD